MTSLKPTFVLVPGGWQTPSPYRTFLDILESRGYSTVALSLPSSADLMPPNPIESDIKLIADTCKSLADAGKEVVLIAHSCGGMTAADAAHGLGVRERQQQGLSGGVRGIVFISASVQLPGKVMGWGERPNEEPLILVEGDLTLLNPKVNVGHKFFSDLPVDEREQWLGKLTRHPLACITYAVKNPAYNEVDLAYIYCEEDQCFSIQGQRAIVDELKRTGLKFKEASLPSGHFPMLSMPARLADTVLELLSD